jgi:hypothetical protein
MPGSLANALRAILSSITNVMAPFATQWSFFSTIPSTVSANQQAHNDRIQSALHDADDAICTVANLDRLLDSFFERSRDITQRFLVYTSEMHSSLVKNTAARRAYVQQFDQVVKLRATAAKTTLPVRTAAHSSIKTFRQSISCIAAEFRARNREFRLLFEAIQLGYERVAEYCASSAQAIKHESETIDFVNDFTSFVNDTHLIRYDLRELEFEVVQPAGLEAYPAIELEIAPVYPIGLAHLVRDHVADGENQLSCTAGKSVFVMEPPDQKWVFVMNPITLESGFIPRLCLEKVGHALAVILKEQGTLDFGECVAILDDSSPISCKVESVFGERLVVLKVHLNVIFTDTR